MDRHPDRARKTVRANNTPPVNQPDQRAPRRRQATPKRRTNRVMADIARLQESRECLLPRVAIYRLVKEIMALHPYSEQGRLRIQSLAMEAIQQAAEAFIVNTFEDCNLLAVHAGRVTVMPKDMQILKRLHASMHAFQKK